MVLGWFELPCRSNFYYIYTLMKREFTINVFLLLLINLLIKPVFIFGVEAEIQNQLGVDAYGWYFHCFNFVFLLSVLNDPGIQNWNAQYIPRNRDKIKTHLATLAGAKMVLGALFVAVTWAVVWLAGYTDYWLFSMLSVNMALSSAFMVLRGSIAGLGHYRSDSWLSGLDKLLMLFLLGYLLYANPFDKGFTVAHLVYGQMAAYFVACIVALVVLIGRTGLILPQFSIRGTVTVLKSSAPFLLILAFMTAYNKMDGILLGLLLDDNHHAAGVYAAAFRIYDAANMTGYLFASVLLPMYAAHLEKKEILEELIHAALSFTLFLSGAAILSVFFYGDQLLQLLYNSFETEMSETLRWLIFAYSFTAAAYIFGTLVVASGEVRRLNYVFAAGFVANLILHFLLIPVYGAMGAAMATFFTQALVLVGQATLVTRQFSIHTDRYLYAKGVALTGGSAVVFYLLPDVFPAPWWLHWLVCVIIYVLLSFLLRLIDWNETRSLLSLKSK